MHDTRRTLLPRVGAILRAKQYVVFFAIALYALDYAAPRVTGRLRHGGSLADVLSRLGSPFVDAFAGRSLLIAGVAIGVAAVTAFFRAGYIRSIVGRFHVGARDGRQFRRLFGLQLAIQAVLAVSVVLGDRLPTEPSGLDLTSTFAALAGTLLIVAVSLVIAYADYAIVVSDLGLRAGLVRSWRVFRLNPLVTMLAFLAVTLLGGLVTALGSGRMTGWITGLLQALPGMVVEVVLFGLVLFVADVVLIVVYLETMESGRLKEDHRGG
jgi:hypothetical protein